MLIFFSIYFVFIQAVPIEFDIYLSFSEDDKSVVEAIQNRLKAAKSDIRIFGEKQILDKEAVWQQDMYQAMMRSARVVTGKLNFLFLKFWPKSVKKHFLAKIQIFGVLFRIHQIY